MQRPVLTRGAPAVGSFDKSGAIASAKIDNYLLEKARVPSQQEGERNCEGPPFNLGAPAWSDALPCDCSRPLLCTGTYSP